MPPSYIDNNVTMEDVRIVFRNFAGREGQYNREGDRNFGVLLDEGPATLMANDGWNVKALKAREEGDAEQPWLPVTISFKGRPPRIVLITSKGRTLLGENECELLDWVDIEMVDLIVRPYEWNVNGKSGIKAYLQAIYVTIREDALERKYSDLDQLPSRSGKVEL